MQHMSPNASTTLPIILTTILLIGLVWFLSTTIITQRTADLVNTIELQLTEQRSLMLSIAETTARNGADSVTEQIVQDCSMNERTRFDELLSRLDQGLSNDELVELERLFGRCGSFYAERKLAMSSRLERELAQYKAYVAQLTAITGEDRSETLLITSWERLVTQEQQLSQEFAKLVVKQYEIISALLAGRTRESEEIQTILREVKEIQDGLIVINSQAASTRSEVSNL